MYYLASVGIGKFTTETEMQMPVNMARTDSFNAEYLMTRIGRWPANSLIILCLLQQWSVAGIDIDGIESSLQSYRQALCQVKLLGYFSLHGLMA